MLVIDLERGRVGAGRAYVASGEDGSLQVRRIADGHLLAPTTPA